MINIISKEQPTPKIGTKEMELKYSLHIQYAGTLSAKEVVAFACNAYKTARLLIGIHKFQLRNATSRQKCSFKDMHILVLLDY